MNPAPRPFRSVRHGAITRVAIGAIAAATMISSCGSDSSDDAPATTNPGSVSLDTTSGGGVPGLEPGSNLPPDDAPGAPSSDTPPIGEPATDNQGDLPGDTVAPE